MRLGLLGAALMATAVFVACGGGSSSGGTAPADDPQVPAGAPFIDQSGLSFEPNKLSVKPGEKVYFKNSESSIHTVTINGKNASGNMKRNAVFVWTAESAGTYKITCEFHTQMRATITVQ